MSPARALFLFTLLFLLNRCGVMGAPVAYVDAYPEPPPPAETPAAAPVQEKAKK